MCVFIHESLSHIESNKFLSFFLSNYKYILYEFHDFSSNCMNYDLYSNYLSNYAWIATNFIFSMVLQVYFISCNLGFMRMIMGSFDFDSIDSIWVSWGWLWCFESNFMILSQTNCEPCFYPSFTYRSWLWNFKCSSEFMKRVT